MIGDKIKELRQRFNFTQKELADKLNIKPSTVGMYEQNRREPSYELLQKISQIFNVTSDYLIFDNEVLEASNTSYLPQKNDIHNILDDLRTELAKQPSLMFKGELLEEQDLRKIFDAMEIGAEIVLKSKNSK